MSNQNQKILPLLLELAKDLNSVKKSLNRLELTIGEPEVAEDLKRRAKREQDDAVDDLMKQLSQL